MPFNETQLATWANQGATTSSATTYNSITTCIDSISWNNDVKYKIYLSGSYKNTTNIRGNSDVDIIVEFESTFYSNALELPSDQYTSFKNYYSDGKYSLDDFKATIVTALEKYYGHENVIVGNKAIRIKGTNGRLDADVVCCAQYREYKTFYQHQTTNYVSGIIFWERNTGNKIVNFPSHHYQNGVDKNSLSSTNYKPVTRIVKNMKSRMGDLNIIDVKLVPSYFLECLIYNVPNNLFQQSNYSAIIPSLLNNLAPKTESELQAFICQNRQRLLFGSTKQQWNTIDCKQFINKLIQFWNAS